MTKLRKSLLLVALALVLVVGVAFGASCKAKYELTYAAGDGTGDAPEVVKLAAGDKVTLKDANTFTAPAGKEFDGWSDGTTKYAAGDEFTMPANAVTLTAQWKAKTEPQPDKYALTYAANGGTGTAPAAEQVAAGTEITLKAANTFTAPAGKEFDGWMVDGVKKAAGDKVTMPAKALTITAQWKDVETPPEPAKYAVTYAANGGTGNAPAAEQVAVGTEITLKANMFTAPAGKEFDGWMVDGVKKAAGDKITMPAKALTITAQWKNIPAPEPAKYAVTYAANGGTGNAPAAEQVAVGTEITLKANMFTAPAGKEFDGWMVDGVKKAAGDKVTMPAKALTITAQWKDAPAITAAANISIPYETQTTEGWLVLRADGTGRIIVENKDAGENDPPVLYDSTLTYTINSQGVLTINSADEDCAITVPATGSIVGHKVSITVATTADEPVQYKFESEVYKLTVDFGFEMVGGTRVIEQYIPAGMTNDFTNIPRDGYKIKTIKADGVTVSLDDAKELAMPAKDVTVVYEWEVDIPADATIVVDSDTTAGTAGLLVLFGDGEGVVYLGNQAAVEVSITYTIVDGVLTINSDDEDCNFTVPAIGSIAGRKVSITLEIAGADSDTSTQIKFEKDVYKMTIDFGYTPEDGPDSVTQYVSVGMTNDFTEETREGYTIKAIKVNGVALPSVDAAKELAMPEYDVTISYEWREIQTVTVTFKNGDDTVKTVELNKGDALTADDMPEDPIVDDDKKFLGWFDGTTEIKVGTTIDEDVVATATWYTITLKVGDEAQADPAENEGVYTWTLTLERGNVVTITDNKFGALKINGSTQYTATRSGQYTITATPGETSTAINVILPELVVTLTVTRGDEVVNTLTNSTADGEGQYVFSGVELKENDTVAITNNAGANYTYDSYSASQWNRTSSAANADGKYTFYVKATNVVYVGYTAPVDTTKKVTIVVNEGDPVELTLDEEKNEYSITLTLNEGDTVKILVNGEEIDPNYENSFNGTANATGSYEFYVKESSTWVTMPANAIQKPVKIYYHNSGWDDNWSEVSAYCWTDATESSPKKENAGWPGEAMTYLGDGWFEINVEEGFEKIIFKGAGTNQTPDRALVIVDNVAYYNYNGVTTLRPNSETEDAD